jgi:hypothetical protein
MKKSLFSFEDDLKTIAAYEELGFIVEVDDAANGIFSCECDLTQYDALALYTMIEDCEREGLTPNVLIGEKIYSFTDGFKAADKLCTEFSK